MEKTIHTAANIALLAALKRARRRAGLSQAELGERLQESQSWVSKLERGERRLDLVEARVFCKAIGIPFVEFVAELDRDLERLDTVSTE